MKVTVYFILLLISLSSCLHRRPRKTYIPRYGVEHNRVRDSLGITLLDSSWVPIQLWEGVTVWGPKEKPIDPCHEFKQVAYFNDTLYCEYDVYGNGEKYQTIDGPLPVSLKIWYVYRAPSSGPYGRIAWSKDTTGLCYEFCNGIGSDWINKAQADSILKAWGLKY